MSETYGPHPTKSTAAIVVRRRCFISLQLSILLRDFSYADFAEFDFAGEMVHLQ